MEGKGREEKREGKEKRREVQEGKVLADVIIRHLALTISCISRGSPAGSLGCFSPSRTAMPTFTGVSPG